MAPILYYTEVSSPSRSVLLTGKALGISFNLKDINVLKGEQYSPEFRRINPQHTVPTLEDEGFIVWDSHAINAYLVEKYGKDDSLYPKDLKKRATVDQRLHFDSAVLSASYMIPAKKIIAGKIPKLSDEDVNSIKEAYGFLEAFLNGNLYVAGNQLTIADFHNSVSTKAAEIFVPVLSTEYPNIYAWLNRMNSLPYFKECNENGLQELSEFIKSKMSN